jgi:hypothetical protein
MLEGAVMETGSACMYTGGWNYGSWMVRVWMLESVVMEIGGACMDVGECCYGNWKCVYGYRRLLL